MIRLLRVLVVTLIALISALAGAQRLPPETIDSLDVQVIRSSQIAVGTVKTAPATEKNHFPTVSFSVQETLRGNARADLSGETIYPERFWQPSSEPKARSLEEMMTAKAPVLILNRPGGQLRIIDLEHPMPVVSTSDFRLLKSPEEILRFVKEQIKRSPTNENIPTVTLDPPPNAKGKAWKEAAGYHGLGGLVVPADARAERQVLPLLDGLTRMNVYAVANKIAPFKSDKNVRRVESLLNDRTYEVTLEADQYNGMEYRDFPKRAFAILVLKRWNVPFQEPETREIVSKRGSIISLKTTVGGEYGPNVQWLDEASKLTQLTIEYGQMTDEDVAAIARHTQLTELAIPRTHTDDARLQRFLSLKNLRSLNLDFDPITDVSLKALAALPNLKELKIANTNVTEEGLRAFSTARPDVRVTTEAKEGE